MTQSKSKRRKNLDNMKLKTYFYVFFDSISITIFFPIFQHFCCTFETVLFWQDFLFHEKKLSLDSWVETTLYYWAEKTKSQSKHPKVKCVNLIGETECSVARFKICEMTKTSLKLSNLSVFWPAPSGTDISFSVIQRCLAVTTLLSL